MAQNGPLFAKLKEQWQRETLLISSVHQIVLNDAYQQIIGLGWPAVPLILRELESEPGHWFWALRAITGCDPIPEGHRGDMDKMREDWLEWGRSNVNVEGGLKHDTRAGAAC